VLRFELGRSDTDFFVNGGGYGFAIDQSSSHDGSPV
jgi:hypothetical protein